MPEKCPYHETIDPAVKGKGCELVIKSAKLSRNDQYDFEKNNRTEEITNNCTAQELGVFIVSEAAERVCKTSEHEKCKAKLLKDRLFK